MDADIKQLLGEIVEHVDKKATETRRHFEVLTEHIDGRFDLLAEQVVANTEKLFEHDEKFDKIDGRLEGLEVKMVGVENRLDGVENKIEGIENKIDNIEKDMKIVKTDVGFIKSELSQKVSRQEFTFLETQVANLENNI